MLFLLQWLLFWRNVTLLLLPLAWAASQELLTFSLIHDKETNL